MLPQNKFLRYFGVSFLLAQSAAASGFEARELQSNLNVYCSLQRGLQEEHLKTKVASIRLLTQAVAKRLSPHQEELKAIRAGISRIQIESDSLNAEMDALSKERKIDHSRMNELKRRETSLNRAYSELASKEWDILGSSLLQLKPSVCGGNEECSFSLDEFRDSFRDFNITNSPHSYFRPRKFGSERPIRDFHYGDSPRPRHLLWSSVSGAEHDYRIKLRDPEKMTFEVIASTKQGLFENGATKQLFANTGGGESYGDVIGVSIYLKPGEEPVYSMSERTPYADGSSRLFSDSGKLLDYSLARCQKAVALAVQGAQIEATELMSSGVERKSAGGDPGSPGVPPQDDSGIGSSAVRGN